MYAAAWLFYPTYFSIRIMRNFNIHIDALAQMISDLQLMIRIRQSGNTERIKIVRAAEPDRIMHLSVMYWQHDTADLYDRLRFYESQALQQIDLSDVTKILTNKA